MSYHNQIKERELHKACLVWFLLILFGVGYLLLGCGKKWNTKTSLPQYSFYITWDTIPELPNTNNIYIGRYAGYHSTGSLCVIIGSDEKAKSFTGEDMVWYVDWCYGWLRENLTVREMLCDYYTQIILKGKDTKQRRRVFIKLLSDAMKWKQV